MKDISEKVIEKIKESNVQPYSKWRFVFHRFVMWVLFGISILLGSIACGITIFQLQYAEWDLYQHLSHSLLEFVILIVPYFWLVFMIGFTVFAYYFFRHTERGYRYSTVALVCLSLGISIAGGFVFDKAGFAERLEGIFRNRVSFYRVLQERKERIWVAPKSGLLAGEILDIMPDGKMKFLDFNNLQWIILARHTVWRGKMKPLKGLKIKIIGRMESKNLFVAEEIRPWRGRKWRHGAGAIPHRNSGFRHRNRGFQGDLSGKAGK